MKVISLIIEMSMKKRLQKLSTNRFSEGPIPKNLQQVNLQTFSNILFDFNSLYIKVISLTDSNLPKK